MTIPLEQTKKVVAALRGGLAVDHLEHLEARAVGVGPIEHHDALIGPHPVGTWVLNFLGSAREVLSEEDAVSIDKALDGLAAVMQGETDIDIDSYFPSLASSPESG